LVMAKARGLLLDKVTRSSGAPDCWSLTVITCACRHEYEIMTAKSNIIFFIRFYNLKFFKYGTAATDSVLMSFLTFLNRGHHD